MKVWAVIFLILMWLLLLTILVLDLVGKVAIPANI